MMGSVAILGAQGLQSIDGIKQFLNFFGIIVYLYLILQITQVMCLYPRPMLWSGEENIALASTYMWFQIEIGVFMSLIFSNAIFLALRTCARNKLRLDNIPERKQLPEVDTILAI